MYSCVMLNKTQGKRVGRNLSKRIFYHYVKASSFGNGNILYGAGLIIGNYRTAYEAICLVDFRCWPSDLIQLCNNKFLLRSVILCLSCFFSQSSPVNVMNFLESKNSKLLCIHY